jgi:hypothetical protein
LSNSKEQADSNEEMEEDEESDISKMQNSNIGLRSGISNGNESNVSQKESDVPATLMASGMLRSSSTNDVLTSNTVKDEVTRNLMMSWYWAGYYTGFQEGQQQAVKEKP